MSDELNPFVGGGGPPAAKFESVGDEVEGKIVSVEYRQDTEPSGKPKFFGDGRPKPCVVLTLATADGEVRDFVNGRSVSKLRAAVVAVEGPGEAPKAGATYRRKLVGTVPSKTPGYSPEKDFEVTYSAGQKRELL